MKSDGKIQKGLRVAGVDIYTNLEVCILKQMPRDIDLIIAQGWIDNPCALKKALRKSLLPANQLVIVDYSSILADWEEYFYKVHGLKTDFSGIFIPETSDEFSWFVCRPENFFAERAFRGGKEMYFKWHHKRWNHKKKSLDDILDMSFGRDAKIEPYIIRVRPNWNADDNLKNLSASMIFERNLNTICLTERLLLGDFLYWKFKKHLDVTDITHCSNSRYINGYTPIVYWDDGWMNVHWYRSYDSHSCRECPRLVVV